MAFPFPSWQVFASWLLEVKLTIPTIKTLMDLSKGSSGSHSNRSSSSTTGVTSLSNHHDPVISKIKFNIDGLIGSKQSNTGGSSNTSFSHHNPRKIHFENSFKKPHEITILCFNSQSFLWIRNEFINRIIISFRKPIVFCSCLFESCCKFDVSSLFSQYDSWSNRTTSTSSFSSSSSLGFYRVRIFVSWTTSFPSTTSFWTSPPLKPSSPSSYGIHVVWFVSGPES